jgi:outer membrane protein assembly factor BamB
VFGGCDEYLHIVSVRDGVKMGEVWAGSYIAGSAAIDQGIAYLGHYGSMLVAIDLQEKKIIWEYMDRKQGDAFFSSPAVGEDRILIGSRDNRLHCVDRKTGEGIWTFSTRDWVESSPVIAGNRVIFGSTDGRLYMVDIKNGGLLWSYEIGAAIIACPAVTAGLIAIGAEDGRIYLFGDKT